MNTRNSFSSNFFIRGTHSEWKKNRVFQSRCAGNILLSCWLRGVPKNVSRRNIYWTSRVQRGTLTLEDEWHPPCPVPKNHVGFIYTRRMQQDTWSRLRLSSAVTAQRLERPNYFPSAEIVTSRTFRDKFWCKPYRVRETLKVALPEALVTGCVALFETKEGVYYCFRWGEWFGWHNASLY